MPNVATQPDALRWYLTGAGSDGGAQADPAAALGNYRSSSEFQQLGVIGALPGLTVDFASGSNGAGNGTLETDGAGNVRWTAPGSSTPGAYVAIADSETKLLLDGGDALKFVRVTRDAASAPAAATATITLVDVFNSLFDNVEGSAGNDESGAGDDEYRCLMLKNDSGKNASDVKAWVKPLKDTSQTSDSAQLAGAGGGTVGTTGSFAGWPSSGWARIVDSGGTLREIVYYSSRTDTVLTVPAGGRGRLGTAADAGAADDEVWSVPGWRIAKEAPSAQPSGFVQTIADEDTAPGGVSWSTGISADDAVEIGTLKTGEIQGLWIHREIIASHVAIAQVRASLAWSWSQVP